MKNKIKTAALVRAAVIAAIYVVLTMLANAFGLASGAIQIRLSEALCVLPIFFPEAIAGLSLGCLIANIITGCVPLDIVFGSLATLIGAIGTYKLKKHRVIAVIPPILSNTIIVPIVLRYAYSLGDAWWYLAITVFAGEVISCAILGWLVIKMIDKYKPYI